MNLRSSSTRNVRMIISRPSTVTATPQPSWVDCAAVRSPSPWSPPATRCTSASSLTPRCNGRASKLHTPPVCVSVEADFWFILAKLTYTKKECEFLCMLRVSHTSPVRISLVWWVWFLRSISPSSGSQQHMQDGNQSPEAEKSSPMFFLLIHSLCVCRVWRSSEGRSSPEEPLLPLTVWGQQLPRSHWLWVAANRWTGLRHRAELHHIWGRGGGRLWLRLHRAVQWVWHQLASTGSLLRFRGKTCFPDLSITAGLTCFCFPLFLLDL